MILRDFLIGIGAKTDSNSFSNANRSMEDLKKTAIGVGAVIAGALATSAMLKNFVDNIVQAGDATIKTANNIGIAVTEFQKLRYSASQSGIATAEMETSLRFLTRGMSEASRGSGNALKWFQLFGINLKNNDGTIKNQTQMIEELSEGFQKLGEADRVGASMDIFGRSGLKMVGYLLQGKEAIQATNKEAEKLGAVVSKDQLEAMVKYSDEMTRLNATTTAIKTEFASALVPVLHESAEDLRNTLVPAVQWLRKNSDTLKSTIKGLATALKWITGIAILTGIGALTIGFQSLGFAGLVAWGKILAPALLVGVAIAATIAIVEDLWLTFTDPKAKTALRELINIMKTEFPDATRIIGKVWEGIWFSIFATAEKVISGIAMLIGTIFGNQNLIDVGMETVKRANYVQTDVLNRGVSDIKGLYRGDTTNTVTINKIEVNEAKDGNRAYEKIVDGIETVLESRDYFQ